VLAVFILNSCSLHLKTNKEFIEKNFELDLKEIQLKSFVCLCCSTFPKMAVNTAERQDYSNIQVCCSHRLIHVI
jgi:hypothetical protein